jgi:hypothetical protein
MPKSSGLKVGGLVVSPTVKRSTSGALDTQLSRDRDRRKDEDQHAAEHGEGAPMPGREPPVEKAAGEQQATDDVDASIAAARERVETGQTEQTIPILLVDPLTGEPIGSV